MKKRFLTIMLSVVLVISMFPMTAHAAGLTIEQLKEKYPHGSTWDESSDGFDGSYECAGFARLMCYEVYGSDYWINNNGNWTMHTNSSYIDNDLKAGDYVRYRPGKYEHSVFVVGVSGNDVAIVDCNWNYGTNNIRWTTLKKSDLKVGFKHVYSAPYALPTATSNTSNVNLRVQYWVSEKGKGWTAEQATEATQFQTGKTYYFWYKIYDAISGKYLNELYPSLNYDVQMTLSGPNGTSGSCSYAKSDCNWYGITVTDAGTYTCEVTVSGGITGSFQAGFSAAAAGIKKPTVYMDKSSISLTVGETTTCTVGVIPYDAATVNYGSENGNICEASVGEITYSQELVSIPLNITGLTPGKTNVKLHFLNNSGNTLATSTISVTVKSGINASTQDMPPVFIYGDGDWIVQTDESEQNTGAANVMGTTGYTLTIGEQSGVEEETTEAPATGSGESNLMVMFSPKPTTPTTSDGSSENQFSDVRKSDYFYESVRWAVNNKITTGTTKTTFSPTVECTNAHFITFLWRAAGYPDPKTTVSLTDASEHDYFYKAAMWALEKGLIFAYSDGGFHPNQPISRSDLVTVLWRYAGSPDVESTTPFTDVQSSMPYAKAVKWAVDNNVTTGTSSTTFSPNTICNRAQIVTFLYRYFG